MIGATVGQRPKSGPNGVAVSAPRAEGFFGLGKMHPWRRGGEECPGMPLFSCMRRKSLRHV